MRIAVLGASGFIGRNLVPRLADDGHEVIAIGRHLQALPLGERVHPFAIDLEDASKLIPALSAVEIAYYLVHSMSGQDFARKDARLAHQLAEAASQQHVKKIVYLGALGRKISSEHLASRREVGVILGSTGVPVVELRAAVILGSGSISFEMLRYLVERLPFMVCPRWVLTRLEPISERDIIEYLVRSIDIAEGAYEVGCGQVTSYRELMDRYCEARGLPHRLVINVPLLTLKLSSYWVDFVTPVNQKVSHALIQSLGSEVIADDREATRAAFGFTPAPLKIALRDALDDQCVDVSHRIFEMKPGLENGVYVVRRSVELDARSVDGAKLHLGQIGGKLSWYGIKTLWMLRLGLGNLIGEHNKLERPKSLTKGSSVDWWVADSFSPDSLVLRTRHWKPGEAWLGYQLAPQSLDQVAAFRPKGTFGFLYWKLLSRIHKAAFSAMADHFVRVSSTTVRKHKPRA